MTESGFDTIFDDLVEGNENQRQLLSLLAEVLPASSLELHLFDGTVLSHGDPLPLAPEEAGSLVQQAHAEEKPVSRGLTQGGFVYAIDMPELEGVLLAVLPGSSDLAQDATGWALLTNSVRLALIKREHEELAVEKEQFIRQINILKQQHGKLIEDNYRQYRLNQEKDKEYARKLEKEIARQTAELREANARLEEISRLKSDFLANMSHELRTPMNAIIGFTELLAETRLDEEQAEYAHTIRQSAASLLALINDILDLAKIEAGKLELEILPFDLPDLVNNVVSMFTIPAKEKGVTVIARIDENIPRRLMGDSNRLRQILVNLAGNAMKFTDKGEIEVSVEKVGETPVEGVVLRFAVKDQGIGIPPDRLQAIFEKFTQADTSTTRKYGGTGLGLSICQQLVQLMNGEIGVESEVGKGSTFHFTIPLAVCHDLGGEIAGKEASPAGEVLAGGRILLVEDNAVNQRLASIIIQRQGFDLAVAADGVEALERIKSQEFDLVLMDIQMPNMDGLAATRKIREIEADPERRAQYVGLRNRDNPLKIIGLTAHARKEDEQACYEAGMDGFLTKPIVKEKLIRAIAKVMQGEGEVGGESR